MQEKEYIRLFNFRVTLCDTSSCNSLLLPIVAGQAKFDQIKDIYGKSHLHGCMRLDIEGGCKVERHGGAEVIVTEDVS